MAIHIYSDYFQNIWPALIWCEKESDKGKQGWQRFCQFGPPTSPLYFLSLCSRDMCFNGLQRILTSPVDKLRASGPWTVSQHWWRTITEEEKEVDEWGSLVQTYISIQELLTWPLNHCALCVWICVICALKCILGFWFISSLDQCES